MIYYIDQSGKVEDTNKITIIAYANGKVKSIKIGAGEKQKLVSVMRTLDNSKKTYIFKVFAGLIFLLLSSERPERIEIDREYPGHESTIKLILIQLFSKHKRKLPEIGFMEIGKQNEAHKTAISVFRKKMKPDIIAKAEEVLKVFYAK